MQHTFHFSFFFFFGIFTTKYISAYFTEFGINCFTNCMIWYHHQHDYMTPQKWHKHFHYTHGRFEKYFSDLVGFSLVHSSHAWAKSLLANRQKHISHVIRVHIFITLYHTHHSNKWSMFVLCASGYCQTIIYIYINVMSECIYVYTEMLDLCKSPLWMLRSVQF